MMIDEAKLKYMSGTAGLVYQRLGEDWIPSVILGDHRQVYAVMHFVLYAFPKGIPAGRVGYDSNPRSLAHESSLLTPEPQADDALYFPISLSTLSKPMFL